MKIVSVYDEAYELDLEAKTWKLTGNPHNVGNLRTKEGKFLYCTPALPTVGDGFTVVAESLSFSGGMRLISIPTLKSVTK